MKKFTKKHFLAVIFCNLSLAAFGGNWSSGGGEILGHSQNPWFLDTGSGTKPIRYCLQVGSDFAVEKEDLEAVVGSAFGWWNDQFGNSHTPINTAYAQDGKGVQVKFSIDTSRIVKEDCQTDTDLRFQFGFLDSAQLAEFKRNSVDLTRFVGLTIRTDYSLQMRGKGFIYIAPDRGPMAFVGQNVRPEAWTQNDPYFERISSVVRHELGHVFGLGHSQESDTLMSARHAENIVSSHYNEQVLDALIAKNNPVFFPKMGAVLVECRRDKRFLKLRAFFEIPASTQCLKIDLSLNEFGIEISESQDNRQWKKWGVGRFVNGGQRRFKSLVSLWLPRDQKVFPALSNINSILLGAASQEIQNKAEFVNLVTGTKKQIFVQAGPRYLQVGGLTEKGLELDLMPTTTFGRSLSGWID